MRVGHAQAASGQLTGVTVVAPPSLPVPAGVATVNGTGAMVAYSEIEERGQFETPIYLCGTRALGTVSQYAVLATEAIVIPVVGECDDSDLADSSSVVAADVAAAVGALGAEVAQGSVGAGTGMQCFDYPGGVGTASRRVGEWTVGVLLLANFGRRAFLGHPPAARPAASHGSCIAVCATDAPCTALELRRLALRPLLGLARAGSYGNEGSGEIAVAFGVGGTDGVGFEALDALFAAAYEAAHESVFNCLRAATPTVRRDGSVQDAFPG